MNIPLKSPSDAPPTICEVELSHIDLRYEGHRMKQPRLEEGLLSSIAQRGIQEPLEGVALAQTHILLNGFKRYRCALKLHLPRAPFLSLGPDEVAAITNLLRNSNKKPLGLLEQARFIDELKETRCYFTTEMPKSARANLLNFGISLGAAGGRLEAACLENS